ncbi:hypothetical protein JL475_36170 [Streptomyces sp. M2CJ-2]|uniref:hypothetical protein n=1 Tax=Streptomyces sp. M2CJ-2 TaxID=2803948 RepID=UPI00192537AB|nr:hypothetical protein [Streptomyces sp. M2CJ-2]MBL3671260.1 hypothetical protein [Streptomyces sp. M2CJ-2]
MSNFIKAHVTRWLAAQGHAAQGELRSFGHCHGDAVDFWLCRPKTHLRFELHPEDYRSWRKAADSLGAKEGRIEWVFGRDDALTDGMVARRGYALLVRCETEGNDRRVFIGTVTDGKRTDRAPLEHCRMTESGLVTPALGELRAKGAVRDDSTPLNWGDLRLRAGGQLPSLHPDDQVALLVAVDRDTPADEPLLSTLVDNSVAAPHRLYRQVRLGLGREPVPDTELETHRAMEVLRLRQLWRYRR